ncbi:MFS transporter [soil metagenome]
MSRPATGLSARAIGYFAARDFIPLYAVYALLFRDHGLSPAAISSLFIVWSLSSFVVEVPSGAWADTVPRRGLLLLSSLLYALAFSLWMVVPSYAGFAAGFVLWGVSEALMSGTFEALVYDELAARDATQSYARLMGWANSAAMVANLIATALAAPLVWLGGYALVGWVSVGVALTQAALAWSLPAAPRVAAVGEDGEPTSPADGLVGRYLSMLRAGLGEAAHSRTVRHAVLISALLWGFLVYDEYFPLVARENGTPTTQVPLVIALVVAGQAIGTALAGRAARLSNAALAWALAAAAVLLAGGAISGRPAGFVAIAVGYGVANNVIIVSEARLQDSIRGPARATVTSASGLLSEVCAVMLLAGFAIGSTWLAVSSMVALLSIPLLLVTCLVPRWLPAPRRERDAVS